MNNYDYEINKAKENQKYKKFEEYTNNQIKEKEKKIIELESQIENLNQEIIGTNQKNMKLQSQINSSQKIKDKNLLKPHKAT